MPLKKILVLIWRISFVHKQGIGLHMRKMQFNIPKHSPKLLQSIASFIGPKLLQSIALFYKWVFGKYIKLANKPQAWMATLLLETMYGEWTLLRDQVLTTFSYCKGIEHLAFINILATTSCSSYHLFNGLQTMLFFEFGKYSFTTRDSIITKYQWFGKNYHPRFQTPMQQLNVFDGYPVENFHSILRGKTRESDDRDMLQ